jgi:hypothetical protein
MIYATLKAIHLLAMALGASASFGNIFLLLAKGPADLPAPALMNALRKWFRLTALVAIVTLWASGAVLLAWHGMWVEGGAFSAKIALATLLLALIAYLNLMAPGWARRGGPPAYVPALHVVGAISLALAIVLAAFAFS